MKICSYIFGCLFFCAVFNAQDTTRILFIGNSFIYSNNMPQMVKSLADSAHLPVITGMHAPGGVSVGDTAQGTMAHMNNPVLFQLIRSRKWDFAVIQDNQGRFVLDSAVFPNASKVVQGHLNIMDSIKANNSCAKIILFGGWAWKYGSPPFGNTGIECIKRILCNYRVLNDTMKEVIAPIGEAWIKATTYLPAVNLWDTDDAHPSYAGSYLTASAIFSTIFNQQTAPLNYNGGIVPATAAKLRAFADSSVFTASFHTKYNLGGIEKIEPYYVNGQLFLFGNFSSCKWFKDGAFVSNTSFLSLPGNGNYEAEITENDGCIVKTCSYLELTTGLTEDELHSGVQVFPNPVSGGRLMLRSETLWQQAELFSMSGELKSSGIRQEGDIRFVSASGLTPGCYLLVLKAENRTVRRKVLICN